MARLPAENQLVHLQHLDKLIVPGGCQYFVAHCQEIAVCLGAAVESVSEGGQGLGGWVLIKWFLV